MENSSDIQHILRTHRGLLKYLERNAKVPVRTVQDVALFYELLPKEDEAGLQLSDWANYVLHCTNGSLEYFASINMEAATHTTEMKKIRCGFLIKEMLNRFKAKTMPKSKSDDKLLWLYSAHDNTIINLLNTLNIYEVNYLVFLRKK